MRRLARYAVVGVFATAAHYLLLTALVEWGDWPAWLGSGLGAVLGAQVAFFGNRWFTFAHTGPMAPAWLKFQGTAVVGALTGMAIVGAGVAAGVHYLAAQVVATLVAMLLTFAINRAWTFRASHR
jgi:putative flippase GtrA